MTRKEHIHTVVSLNPIMIDGTGMCGGCRVMVEGKSEFGLRRRPEFDAHRVDFCRPGAAQFYVSRRGKAVAGRVPSGSGSQEG